MWGYLARRADALMVASVVFGCGAKLVQAHTDSPTGNADTPIQASYKYSYALTATDMARIKSGDVVVFDNVLDETTVNQIGRELQSLMATKNFTRHSAEWTGIRGDTVNWVTKESLVDPQSPNTGLLHVHSILRGIANEIQQFPEFSGAQLLVPQQCQLACYDPAVNATPRYAAHRDGDNSSFWDTGLLGWLRNKSYRQRTVTAILYLNPVTAWKKREEDEMKGGCLRCYLGASPNDEVGTTAKDIVDIVPVGGRMVVFDSQLVLHEVLAMEANNGEDTQRRMAMTIWIQDENMA